VSPAVLAFDGGGGEARTQAMAGVVALALLGVLAVVAPWPLVERSWPLLAAGLLVALAGWVALSITWSDALGDAVDDLDRVAFYAAAFALAVVVMRVPAIRRVAPDVLLWGIVAVVLYALAGRWLPSVVDVTEIERAGDRLHRPLSYWNAMGILSGFGVLLAVARFVDERAVAWYRALAAAAAVACAVACYLTLSRASWAAVGAGLVVLVALRARSGWLRAYGGRLAAAAVVAVLVGGVLVSFVGERTEDIAQSAERVTSIKTYRGDYWRVALGSFADHPVAGVGAASFQVEWIRERDSRVFSFDAHSLYFETLAELGLVGGLLLGGLFAAVIGGLRRHRRELPDDPLLAPAAAVLGAFAVHAGLDWDWEMPSVTLVALLLAAAVVQRPEPS
jgi:O-antigen ligase